MAGYLIKFHEQMIQPFRHILAGKKLLNFPEDYCFRGCLDSPRENDTCIIIKGWALSKKPIRNIELHFENDKICDVTMDKDRADVNVIFPDYPKKKNGFEFTLNKELSERLNGRTGRIFFRFYDEKGKYVDKFMTLVRFPDLDEGIDVLDGKAAPKFQLKLRNMPSKKRLEKFPADFDFHGYMDEPQENDICSICKGWYISKIKPPKVEFFIDNEKIFDIERNEVRTDVALARPNLKGPDKSGFNYPLPKRVMNKFAGKKAVAFIRFYVNDRNYVDAYRTSVKFPKKTSSGLLEKVWKRLAALFGVHFDPAPIKYYQVPLDRTNHEEDRSAPAPAKTDIKLIAFYFPQFHPFPENDRFWGKGYTEWTNVTKALPQFEGHYQPRLPGELGFYDLRIKDVMKRQIELAKNHGIHGFCFHHFWFSGKPVMRVPYEHIINDSDLDIPFCLHWANEPWTVRWDGCLQNGVLLQQSHSAEDDMAFIKDIEPALRDKRYIKIDGRPLLIIYRPGLFPDVKATINRWNEYCEKKGIGKLYMAVMHSCFDGEVNPVKFGFDAAVQYPPHNMKLKKITETIKFFDPNFKGNVFSYPYMVEEDLKREPPDYTLFRGVFPEWDCTARRNDPDIYAGSSPELYKKWLEGVCRYARKYLPQQKRLVFINAWNEWAEGAYLEPDRKYGYAYLNKTADVMSRFTREN